MFIERVSVPLLLASEVANAVAFDDVAKYFPEGKTALVGIPIRKAFLTNVENPKQKLGLPADKPLVFVTGGSIGSQRINRLILESRDELLPNYVVLHQTGANNEEDMQQTSSELITNSALLQNYFIKGSLTGEEMHIAQSAAVTGWHLAEWIFKEFHKGTNLERNNFFKKIKLACPELQMIHDIANAYKHPELTSHKVCIDETRFVKGFCQKSFNKAFAPSKLQVIRNGKKHDFIDVLEAVRLFWKTYFDNELDTKICL